MNGTTHCTRSCKRRRENSFSIQKIYDYGHHWRWWARDPHDFDGPEWRKYDTIHEGLSLINRMVRGGFEGRLSRRQLQVCLLETRYPCTEWRVTAVPQKPVKRRFKEISCEQTRSVQCNKPTENEDCTVIQRPHTSKKGRHAYRRTSNPGKFKATDSIVFQSLGFLITEWLEPVDLLRVKQSFRCTWKWNLPCNPQSARAVALIQAGANPEHIIEEMEKGKRYDIIRHLPLPLMIKYAYMFQDLRSIRKLYNIM